MDKGESNIAKGKVHYAWVILICCSTIPLVSLGLLGVCRSNFLSPVVEELGCKVSEYTLYTSIGTATAALFYPISSHFLKTRHVGKWIAFGEATQLISIGMMSQYHSIYSFYVSGFFYGLGSAFTTFMAVPILINQWFAAKTGLAMGIAMSFRGIGAAVFSPFVVFAIKTWGWRNAYLIVAAIGAVLTLPFSILFIKRPQDMGMHPYGYIERTEQEGSAPAQPEFGLTRAQSFRYPALYLAWLPGMIFSATALYSSYLPSFSTMELGYDLTVGATAMSIVSVASILCNIILGPINDRFGLKMGLLWGCGCMISGLTCFLLSRHALFFLYLGALLFGLGGGMYTVQVPLLIRGVIGTKYYADSWPFIMTVNSLTGAIAYPLMVSIYDRTGSYRGMFWLGIFLLTAAFLLGYASVEFTKRRRNNV